jgi:hypothetical protein
MVWPNLKPNSCRNVRGTMGDYIRNKELFSYRELKIFKIWNINAGLWYKNAIITSLLYAWSTFPS